MKDKVTTTVIIATICLIVWTIMSKYIGFETTVLCALALIYGSQK